MASIFSRRNRDGSFTWRVQIRRVGIPQFCMSFATKEEAEQFVEENEEKYINDPNKYLLEKEQMRLKRSRNREFYRKKISTVTWGNI